MTLCNPGRLREEIRHLKDTFQCNRHSLNDIRQAIHSKQKKELEKIKPKGIAVLPYQQTISNKISIPKKNIHMLRMVKDDLGLKVPGVYRIPCECGKVYVGQRGRSIDARCKEHMRHICLDQPEKSVVAEHSVNTGHQIDFSNITILDGTSGYMDRVVKEAIHIRLNRKNFNRDNGFNLSQVWFPVMSMLANQNTEQGIVGHDRTHRSPVASRWP
jgi:hypothetical protein